MGRFLLIVREFQFVVCRLLVVYIAGVTAFETLNLAEEHKVATLRYVEDLTRYSHFLRIQWISLTKSYLVEGLRGWAKSFTDL